MAATKTATERNTYTRNELISSLLKIGHRDLTGYIAPGLAAASTDADLFGHLIAWNEQTNKVRDAKVALPPLALRGLTRQDADLAENAVAHMLLLGPRELVRSYEFSKQLTRSGYPVSAGWRKLMQSGIQRYLAEREASRNWWDKTVLQHRKTVKFLYRLAHKKPTAYAQQVLFNGIYPANSIFSKVAELKNLSPREAAGSILVHKIPLEVAIGSVATVKDNEIVLALIEGMTGNQLINNAKMLQKLGVMSDQALKGAFEAALERAKKSTKTSTLKAGQAAVALSDSKLAQKMSDLQEAKVSQLAGLEGDWLVLGDRSGSMSSTIDLARQIAGFIARQVKGKVYLVFFDSSPTFIDVTGKSYEEILTETRRIGPGGQTSMGCGLDYLRKKGMVVNGIAVATDGGENATPWFADIYKKYCTELGVEPTVYEYLVGSGYGSAFAQNCQAAGIALEQFNLGRSVDYYSLPNLVAMMHTNRYQIFDDIMATPLRTINSVYERN